MRAYQKSGIATFWLGISLGAFPVSSAVAADVQASIKSGSSTVEKIAGSDLKRITLTAKAAERLAIKTGKTATDASGVMTVPYAALVYDSKGKTWVYTNPEPLVYVRASVDVASIKGPNVILKDGPAAGTNVVVTGVAELYGAESGMK